MSCLWLWEIGTVLNFGSSYDEKTQHITTLGINPLFMHHWIEPSGFRTTREEKHNHHVMTCKTLSTSLRSRACFYIWWFNKFYPLGSNLNGLERIKEIRLCKSDVMGGRNIRPWTVAPCTLYPGNWGVTTDLPGSMEPWQVHHHHLLGSPRGEKSW